MWLKALLHSPAGIVVALLCRIKICHPNNRSAAITYSIKVITQQNL